MEKNTVLILGGGFGGLTAAQNLRRLLPSNHRIAVVERKNTFRICSFNMQLVAGEIKDPHEGERDLSGLRSKGIEWVQGEVQGINPELKTVVASAGTLEADNIIVALGAEKIAGAVPGFTESAYNLYDADGSMKLGTALEAFEGGQIIVLISGTPFSCPAAPYEAAFLMDSAFRKKGNRQKVEISIYTPEARPLPAAGPEMGNAVREMLKERNIGYYTQQKLQKIDSTAHKVFFEAGEAFFDLLVGVPRHATPRVVKEAGLTDETGWVPVDLQTLETRYPGVFAIGDVTIIRQPNPTGMLLPKAWVFAEEQGRVVAENIAARLGRENQLKKFDGKGSCYLETGDGMAAYGSGDFYAYPAPRVYLEPPSQRFHKERRELEQERLEALV